MQQHENWARKSTCPRRQTEWHLRTYGQSTEMTSLSRRTTQPSTEREAAVGKCNCRQQRRSQQANWWVDLLLSKFGEPIRSHNWDVTTHHHAKGISLDLGIRWQGICNYEDSDQRLRTRFTRDFYIFPPTRPWVISVIAPFSWGVMVRSFRFPKIRLVFWRIEWLAIGEFLTSLWFQ